MFAACTGSASGRIVVGWFPPQRRGLAMGIRQMAQPLGVAIAAATIAVVAERVGVSRRPVDPRGRDRPSPALAVAVLVHRPAAARRATDALTANPYRADSFLARVHGVSVLLVVPQFLVWTYSLTWLVQERALVGRRGRCARRRSPTCSAPWAGSPSASSPTWSARGCGRCAGSRSPPPSRWGCWP